MVIRYWKRTVLGADELDTCAVKPPALPEILVTEPSGELTEDCREAVNV